MISKETHINGWIRGSGQGPKGDERRENLLIILKSLS